MSASLVYAFDEALAAIEEEGLESRWARHAATHARLCSAMAALGLDSLVPADERLMTLNTVRIPAGGDDAAVRTGLREKSNIEIGGGMAPLAGKIWRIGLMGAGATAEHVDLLVAGLEAALKRAGQLQ